MIGKNVKLWSLFNFQYNYYEISINLLVSSEYVPPHSTDFFLTERIFN